MSENVPTAAAVACMAGKYDVDATLMKLQSGEELTTHRIGRCNVAESS